MAVYHNDEATQSAPRCRGFCCYGRILCTAPLADHTWHRCKVNSWKFPRMNKIKRQRPSTQKVQGITSIMFSVITIHPVWIGTEYDVWLIPPWLFWRRESVLEEIKLSHEPATIMETQSFLLRQVFRMGKSSQSDNY